MADYIEVVSDGEGVVVAGEQAAIERFLCQAGLLPQAIKFDLGKIGGALRKGSDVMEMLSGVVEQQALYLKLTPESAQRLKDAGGLMSTKTKGISHAMLGETGKKSLKWLQVEDGPASLILNPAVLSGIGGLMSQFAQQTEAQEFKALLVKIDEKLNDVRRAQRDDVLASLKSTAAAIEEASIIRQNGGDPETLWDKVSGVSEKILNVQDRAVLELLALAEKADARPSLRQLKASTHDLEGEVAVWLAVLARCFELQDEFGVLELEHVLSTAPGNLDGHRLGLQRAREARRGAVLGVTAKLTKQMDAAGCIANENIVLHALAARSVVDSLNSTAEAIDDFHTPFGITTSREAVSTTPWREAIRDGKQLKTAGKEVGKKGITVAGAVAGVAVVVVGVLKRADSSE